MARRRATHGERHRLQLQLPDRVRARQLPFGAGRDRNGHGELMTRRTSSSARAPRPTSPRCGCPSSPSTSGVTSRATRTSPNTRTRRRSSAPAPSRSWSGKKGVFVRCEANKDYWGGAPKVDETIFTRYKNQDTMPRTSSSRPSTSPSTSLPRRSRPSTRPTQPRFVRVLAKGLRLPVLQLLRGPIARQSRAPRRHLPRRPQSAVDKVRLVGSPTRSRRPGGHLLGARLLDFKLDWHWTPRSTPPSRSTSKAKEALADPSYTDTDGNGVVNDPNNGDRTSRWPSSRRESLQSQSIDKFITGLVKDVDVDIEYSVQATACSSTAATTTTATRTSPTTTSTSGPGSRAAPTRDAASATPHRPDGEPERRLLVEPGVRPPLGGAVAGARPAGAQGYRWRMQQIFYEESPYIILTYPKTLQGWNTSAWEGWTRIPENRGAVAYLSDNVQTTRWSRRRRGGGGERRPRAAAPSS